MPRPKGSQNKRPPGSLAYDKELTKGIVKERKAITQALVDKAKTGDVPAIKEVNERVLGKVKDSLEIGGSKIPITILANVQLNPSDKKNTGA